MKNKSIAKSFLNISSVLRLNNETYESVIDLYRSTKFSIIYLNYATYDNIYGKYKNE